MDEELDIERLHALVDSAMHGDTNLVADVALEPVRASHPTPPGRASMPFTLMNMAMFEHIATIFQRYLGPVDCQVALDDLRTEIMQGYDLGDLPTLHALASHCRKCPNVVPGANSPIGNLANPDIVFVHEYPAHKEYVMRNFTPTADMVGLNARHIMHTSVVRCSIPQGRNITSEEVANCQKFLFAEIQLLRPKLIVTLGNTATSVFLGDVTAKNDRGVICWLGPWAILPTYALGYVAQRASAQEAFQSDLQIANDFCYGSRP